MGDGLVLESGTHHDLIQADGAYARLVQSQKLREEHEHREGRESSNVLDSDISIEESRHSIDSEKEKHEKILLGRKNTPSEVLEQKQGAKGENKKEKDYDFLYLAKRMVPIMRDQWKSYLLGTVFACRTCFSFVYIYSFLTSRF